MRHMGYLSDKCNYIQNRIQTAGAGRDAIIPGQAALRLSPNMCAHVPM